MRGEEHCRDFPNRAVSIKASASRPMFECGACTLRCIRAIAGDTFAAAARGRRSRLPTSRALLRRPASTAVAPLAPPQDDFVPFETAPSASNGLAVGKNETTAPSQKSGRITIENERSLRRELQYLPDPLKLAEHVHYTLRCNNPDKALDLCRLASKRMSCVVSWNHVINWHMQQRPAKTSDALKIYNEMKKRAQFPDSHTYLLLLRGLVGQANHHRKVEVKEENASKALAIYNSMASPTSRVKPSIIHTNAALQVCSFAFDMDAFWSVAGKLPSHGPGSADHITYTIILTALKHGAVGKNTDVDVQEVARKKAQAVNEGRRVWLEVVARWRAGEVKIDENLVTAMARVLLLSSRLEDWDDVLSLIEQTMKIERLVAPVGSPERQTEHVPRSAAEGDWSTEYSESEQQTVDSVKDTPAAKVFKPINPLPPEPGQKGQTRSLAFVAPGNDTLSVIIEACVLMRAPKTANAYWDLLTNHHDLKPDLLNFQAHLRLLRLNRASAKAAHVIKQLPEHGLQPKNSTFRLAMAVCARDKNNHNVLDHARCIIDVMEQTTADVDVHTLQQYLELTLTSDDGKKISTTLDRLDSIVHTLRSRMIYGTVSRPMSPSELVRDNEDIVKFFRTMIGTIDTLMNRGLVPRETYQHWQDRRRQLSSFIGRAQVRVERQREKMSPSGGMESGNGDGTYNIQESRELKMFRGRRTQTEVGAHDSGLMHKSLRGKVISSDLGRRWDEKTTYGPRRKEGKISKLEARAAFADSPAELGI